MNLMEIFSARSKCERQFILMRMDLSEFAFKKKHILIGQNMLSENHLGTVY